MRALFSLLISVLMLQHQIDPVRPLRLMEVKARSLSEQDASERALEYQKKQFEEKFNKLIDTLADFTREYNQNNGRVWPAKKAEALQKAFRELQETEAWLAKRGSQ
jgi:hypothetical protein